MSKNQSYDALHNSFDKGCLGKKHSIQRMLIVLQKIGLLWYLRFFTIDSHGFQKILLFLSVVFFRYHSGNARLFYCFLLYLNYFLRSFNYLSLLFHWRVDIFREDLSRGKKLIELGWNRWWRSLLKRIFFAEITIFSRKTSIHKLWGSKEKFFFLLSFVLLKLSSNVGAFLIKHPGSLLKF